MNDPHISIEDLLAFISDEEPLSPSTQQHLERCPDCQQQAASYQTTATYLLAQLYRCGCPSAASLSAWCLPDALTTDEQRHITKHLTLCPLCTSELAETRQFLETP
ncbi:MAG: hypothetical protein ACRDHZ_02555 [Ktedonobacteraceae bacterium]